MSEWEISGLRMVKDGYELKIDYAPQPGNWPWHWQVKLDAIESYLTASGRAISCEAAKQEALQTTASLCKMQASA